MDEAILLWINQGWAHPWLDAFFTWVSSRPVFALPFTLTLAWWCHRNWGRPGLAAWGLLLVTVGLGDFIGGLLKDLVQQPRPCFAIPQLIRIPGYPPGTACGSALTGWPSNHALNYCTVAAFLFMLTRDRRLARVLFAIAILVGLSRVYLAKHYPSQVAAGAIIGLSWGLLAARLVSFRLSLGRDPGMNNKTEDKAHIDE